MPHPCEGHPCDNCSICRSGRCCGTQPTKARDTAAEERSERDLITELKPAMERDAQLGHGFLRAFEIDRIRSLSSNVLEPVTDVNASVTDTALLALKANNETEFLHTHTTSEEEAHRAHP